MKFFEQALKYGKVKGVEDNIHEFNVDNNEQCNTFFEAVGKNIYYEEDEAV